MSNQNRPLPTRRLRLEAIGLLVVALVVGVLVGVTAERWRVSQTVPERSAGFRRDSGRFPSPLSRIDLTDSQRTQIDAIFRSRRERTDSILRDIMPQSRFHTDDVREGIADILTAEQLEQLDREFEAMRLRRGDPLGERRGFRGGRGRDRLPPDERRR